MSNIGFNRLAWDILEIDTRGIPVVFDLLDLPEVPEGKIRIYHYTPVENVAAICFVGLLNGRKINKKEKLPFIMASIDKDQIFSKGSIIVADVDIVHKVNSTWVHIYQDITPEEITAVYISDVFLPVADVVRVYKMLGLA